MAKTQRKYFLAEETHFFQSNNVFWKMEINLKKTIVSWVKFESFYCKMHLIEWHLSI